MTRGCLLTPVASISLDQLLCQTDDNLKKGFRAIKMKVGRSRFSEDLERVRTMRDHLGADFPLMVDANMRWSVDEAVRAARGLSEFAVYWLEEPTIPDDVEGHRRIVRDGGLPIATGENYTQSSWLVGGVLPGIERQPHKCLRSRPSSRDVHCFPKPRQDPLPLFMAGEADAVRVEACWDPMTATRSGRLLRSR